MPTYRVGAGGDEGRLGVGGPELCHDCGGEGGERLREADVAPVADLVRKVHRRARLPQTQHGAHQPGNISQNPLGYENLTKVGLVLIRVLESTG